MANTGVDMNLGLGNDFTVCIIHSAGLEGNSRITQWYHNNDTVLSTWMVPRGNQGAEFKCMYSVYTGSRMNISICNLWASGAQDANLLGWNGYDEQIHFWPVFAIIPV